MNYSTFIMDPIELEYLVLNYYINQEQKNKIAISLAKFILNNYHSKNKFHGDIKPDNVIVNSDYDAYLIDNIESKGLKIKTQHNSGSLLYSPPEYLSGKEYTRKGDCYSYGKVLFFIENGRHPPFPPFDEERNTTDYLEEGFGLVHSPNVRWLVNKLCNPDPKSRIEIETAIKLSNGIIFPNLNVKSIDLMVSEPVVKYIFCDSMMQEFLDGSFWYLSLILCNNYIAKDFQTINGEALLQGFLCLQELSSNFIQDIFVHNHNYKMYQLAEIKNNFAIDTNDFNNMLLLSYDGNNEIWDELLNLDISSYLILGYNTSNFERRAELINQYSYKFMSNAILKEEQDSASIFDKSIDIRIIVHSLLLNRRSFNASWFFVYYDMFKLKLIDFGSSENYVDFVADELYSVQLKFIEIRIYTLCFQELFAYQAQDQITFYKMMAWYFHEDSYATLNFVFCALYCYWGDLIGTDVLLEINDYYEFFRNESETKSMEKLTECLLELVREGASPKEQTFKKAVQAIKSTFQCIRPSVEKAPKSFNVSGSYKKMMSFCDANVINFINSANKSDIIIKFSISGRKNIDNMEVFKGLKTRFKFTSIKKKIDYSRNIAQACEILKNASTIDSERFGAVIHSFDWKSLL